MSNGTFQGFWLLHDTNEKFLSNRKNDSNQGVAAPLGQVTAANSWERFTLIYNQAGDQVQIKSNETGNYLAPNIVKNVLAFSSSSGVWLLCNDEGGGRFSLSPVGSGSWVCFGGTYYTLTGSHDLRSIFTPIKQASAPHLGDPGVGEVAIYSAENYGGTGWIFCQPYSNFNVIAGLNDTTQSIKLGPQAGATLWQNHYSGNVMDFATSQPTLSGTGFAAGSASSIEVWQLSTPTSVLAEGEAVLYRSQGWVGAGRLIQQNEATLHRYASGSLLVGPNTAVTLYAGAALSGAAQTLAGDVYSFGDGLAIGASHAPASLAIGPDTAAYAGSYALQRATNADVRDQGSYMAVSMGQDFGSGKLVGTYPWVSTWERFAMTPVAGSQSQFRLYTEDLQFEIQASGSRLVALPTPAPSVWTRVAEDDGTWSLQSDGQWLSFTDTGFLMTGDPSQRERFIFLKAASSESLVGALAPGEVAVYQLPNYRGCVFVFDSDNVVPSIDPSGASGPMPAQSIRVGANSGFWAYSDRAGSNMAASFDSSQSRLGTPGTGAGFAAIRIWTLLEREAAPFVVDSLLMQDYVAPPGQPFGQPLQQLSYRVAITPLNPAVDDRIEICVAEPGAIVRCNGTQITGQGLNSYPVSAQAQVALSITAQDIRTTSILVRAPSMPRNQYVIFFPDEQVHRMLATVTGADIAAGGNPLVSGYTPEQAESTANAVRNLANAIIGGYREDSRRNVPAMPTSVRLTQGTSAAANAGMRRVPSVSVPGIHGMGADLGNPSEHPVAGGHHAR